MKIGIPKEIQTGETRVAVIPALISALSQNENQVLVERGAGEASAFHDEQYREAGAQLIAETAELYKTADIILKVQPPQKLLKAKKHEVELLREGSALIGFLAPLTNLESVQKLKIHKISSFAMEFIPRITRAQSMDALSSMATIAGYKAVLIAADHLPKMCPLMMTAAGTIPPATVMVLGAGVAGLQAIATAKRLGAKVEAFDPRPAVKEQVESLGAQFIAMETPEGAETEGGYAKELPEEFLRREQDTIAARLPKVDVVITTAQIFGKQAPILLTEEMVGLMNSGSVVVDLAAEQGGNCALTKPNETIVNQGVKIVGTLNLPALLPVHASQMYAKNIINLFNHIYGTENGKPNFDDEITKGACITHNGKVVNDLVNETLHSGGTKK